MAMLHGKGGSITWAGTALAIPAEITSWTADSTADVAETTSMAAAGDWKTFLAGFKDWTASIDTIWDSADIQLLTDLGGIAYDLQLEMIDAGAQVHGTAIMTGVTITTDMNDAIKVSFSFQGSGALAYA